MLSAATTLLIEKLLLVNITQVFDFNYHHYKGKLICPTG